MERDSIFELGVRLQIKEIVAHKVEVGVEVVAKAIATMLIRYCYGLEVSFSNKRSSHGFVLLHLSDVRSRTILE